MTAPAALGGKEVHIGDLVLDGGLVKSKWADQNMFFRHQRVTEDFKLNPEWEKYVPTWGSKSIFSCPVRKLWC
jgi:hypothetical protein